VKTKPFLIIFLSVILILLSFACSGTASTLSKTRIAAVTRGDIKTYITAVGNLVSAQESKLTFGSSAKVTSILVKIGDVVAANQTLAKIDTINLERAVHQAEMNYRSGQQALEDAKQPKSSAPDPLNIEQKEFDLESKKIALDNARQDLIKATIIAPFDGIIAEVNITVGNTVGATDTAIRLIGPTQFKVTMSVNEADIHKIALGSPAIVQMEAIKTLAFPGTITFISPTATIQSNVVNYKVEVQLDTGWAMVPVQQGSSNTTAPFPTPTPTPSSGAPQTGASQGRSTQRSGSAGTTTSSGGAAVATVENNIQIREGQTVIVSIISGQANNVLLVPNRVITTRSGKSYANVVLDKGVIEERLIQIGMTDGENTQVTSGLNENEQVLIIVVASTSTGAAKTTGSTQGMPPGGGGVVPDMNRLLR
jgi:multidrug efflux pump subunit AcrA (membrane-fusion protein)